MMNKSLYQIFFLLLFILFSIEILPSELILTNTTQSTSFDEVIISKINSLKIKKEITKIELKIYKFTSKSEVFNLNKDGSINIIDGDMHLSAIVIVHFENKKRDIRSINIFAESEKAIIDKLLMKISKIISS